MKDPEPLADEGGSRIARPRFTIARIMLWTALAGLALAVFRLDPFWGIVVGFYLVWIPIIRSAIRLKRAELARARQQQQEQQK